MASYTISPIWGAGAQLFDNSGNPLVGGKIYTYYAGSTTPLTTYTTPTGSTANSNPIIANSAGRLTNEIWFPVSGSYKFVLKDANDVLLATYDNIPTTPQPPIVNDASSISYQQGYEVNAGNFTIGATYLITSVGTTDFVAIGAAANVTGILFTATGIGSGTGKAAFSRTVQSKLQEYVSVKDFGAVGDGVTDDTAAIQAALSELTTLGGGYLYFGNGETYLVTDELSVPEFVEIDLNGSTINFACVGAKRLLAIDGSNVRVFNGVVNNTVGTPGQEGTYQTPIVLGQYTVLNGVTNVVLENLTISTVLNKGNGIVIFGDSENITINNITFPTSSTLGIGVLAHWSFDEAFNTGPTYTGVTTHPHNIKISNLYFGDMTYSGVSNGFGVAGVFLSAVYNVSVENLYMNSMPKGQMLTVYAGDWGFQFATTKEQELGSCGINAKNFYGSALFGVQTYMKNPLQSIKKVWPASIVIDNFNVYGLGSLNAENKGARIDVSTNVTVKNCTFDNMYSAIYFGPETTNCKIYNNVIKNSYTFGATLQYAQTSSDIEFSKNNFTNSNVSNTSNKQDIYAQYVNNLIISENVFDSANVTHNIRIEGGANAPSNVKIFNNLSKNVSATGPCYSIAYSSDYLICTEFYGNDSVTSPSNGIRGGQYHVPTQYQCKSLGTDQQKICFFNDIPAGGNWTVGDIIYRTNPVASGSIGWVCVTAGSPGTWKTFGTISA